MIFIPYAALFALHSRPPAPLRAGLIGKVSQPAYPLPLPKRRGVHSRRFIRNASTVGIAVVRSPFLLGKGVGGLGSRYPCKSLIERADDVGNRELGGGSAEGGWVREDR